MEKELKNYLPFYLGCKVLYKRQIWVLSYVSRPYKTNDTAIVSLDLRPEKKGYREIAHISESFTDLSLIKLILRPLSDRTDEEKDWLSEHENFVDNYKQNAEEELIIEWEAEKTVYLLSKYFDLFGLHESGLCLYKNKKGGLY